MWSLKHLFVALVAATSVTANLISVRDVATVSADFKAVNNDVSAVTSAVKSFTGVSSYPPVAQALNQLNKDVQKTGNDTVASPVFSSTDCNNLINYISGTLEPNVKVMINEIINKKALFSSTGTLSSVRNLLKSVQISTVNTLNALCKSCKSSTCTPLVTTASNDYQKGIDSLSS